MPGCTVGGNPDKDVCNGHGVTPFTHGKGVALGSLVLRLIPFEGL